MLFLFRFLKVSGRKCVHSAFLTCALGRYSDRRSRGTVDTSQTIWIFATNAADDAIIDFFQIHENHLTTTDDPMLRNKLIMQLTMAIKKQLKSTYGVSAGFSHLGLTKATKLSPSVLESTIRPNIGHCSVFTIFAGRSCCCRTQVRSRVQEKGVSIHSGRRQTASRSRRSRHVGRWSHL